MDACQESDWSPTEAKSKKIILIFYIGFLIFSNINQKTMMILKRDNSFEIVLFDIWSM